MPLHPNALERLRLQPSGITALLDGKDEAVLSAHPVPDKWSALENLAHLTRYHQVFLGRLEQILVTPNQPFPRYKAELDPEWPQWQAMNSREVLDRFRRLRAQMQERLQGLREAQLSSTGLHPAFGVLDVPTMLEMFLVHEGHHLYVMFQRIHEQRR